VIAAGFCAGERFERRVLFEVAYGAFHVVDQQLGEVAAQSQAGYDTLDD
jgi:hypothetical protein